MSYVLNALLQSWLISDKTTAYTVCDMPIFVRLVYNMLSLQSLDLVSFQRHWYEHNTQKVHFLVYQNRT